MIIRLAAALLVPILAVFTGLALLWPTAPAARASVLLKLMLAVPLGLGLSSVGFFLWLVAVGPGVTMLSAVEVAVLLTLAVLLVRRRHVISGSPALALDVLPVGQARLLPVALALLLILALASFGALSVASPHGWWDAISIWNLRARFIFRGGEYWTDGLTPLLIWTHPDYPLLLPGVVARAWKLIGSESTAVPIVIAFLFTFCTVGTLASGVSRLRGRAQGVLAGVALLGSAPLIWHGATQYADIPLGLFILATLTLLALHEQLAAPGAHRFLVLAGVSAGLAAWTKNEGLVFVITLLLAYTAVVARAAGWQASARRGAAILLGLLPVILVVVGFKLTLAPPNDIIAAMASSSTLARLADPARYGVVLGALLERFVFFGSAWLGMPVMLTVYAALVGVRRRPLGAIAVNTSALTLALLLAVYTAAFLTTPYGIEWHVYTALDRLLLHLWPATLLCFFLAVRAPGELQDEESPAEEGQGSETAVA
ncbi:MAG TPA: hypothetical protein VLC48_06240 [Gemmatimonadota bacterium]|nr:hypothetical protein [Gemmatimonadota bacterium]